MTYHVIDTNVLSVANGAHTAAGPACKIKCVAFLVEVKQRGVVILDDARLILREYERNVQRGGQPRTGYQFYKWLRDTHARQKKVVIHRKHGDQEDYIEFPSEPDLTGFDPADRKFVAVALASQHAPPIANATDRDWVTYYHALRRHGVAVHFLCPDLCAPSDALEPDAGETS